MGQNRQGQGVLGKATLNWGPTWMPDGDAHTCTPTPRPSTGPEAGTLRPPEPTSWGAHSRVETSLNYWRRKCSHRPRRRGSGRSWAPNSTAPLQPQPERPVPAQGQASLSRSFPPFLWGQLPLHPGPPRPLPGPQCPQDPGSPASLAPRDSGLTSYFSGAPEMRKSLLNTTGGLSPPEKLGLSVTFFLQGRTRQTQCNFQVPYSSICSPLYPGSLAQGTPELLPPISKMGWAAASVSSLFPSILAHPSPASQLKMSHTWAPVSAIFRTPAWLLCVLWGHLYPLAARMRNAEINSLSGELMCV